MSKPFIKSVDTVNPVNCPCGMAKRIVTSEDFSPVGFHVVKIKKDSKCLALYKGR